MMFCNVCKKHDEKKHTHVISGEAYYETKLIGEGSYEDYLVKQNDR